MNNEELENKLFQMSKPQFSGTEHQENLKLAILSSKTSSKLSLWLLSLPFLVLIGALLETTSHIEIPPWSWIHHYGPTWPYAIRISVFLIIVIIIPFFVVLINLLSITWLQYNRDTKILNISIRIKPFKMILLLVGAIIGGLFTIHSIMEWLNHAK